ncbi:tRNA lysidine(34) synthetase TilS [Methylocystis sp. JR02]|uniref:tRNA lysidine(34) synthetase TilS n=1 Tax=Methylocystis sp. JR02 TaxID=3046284 RepID=UPI0024BA58A2|nr:tRNA lysidine(34) synthetase TilS [Methylocystis sp. JR02]MDJ0447766.1 tRNA lysidine(34) synthetase TilS [Methylocystis sp. JR02]
MTLDKAAGAFALLAPYERLLLAVSGGPDSIALMLLCAQWPERASHEIAVATVDHGLRADARAEAQQVGEWARTLGFAHHLLSWEGEKPQTRIQERARAARYALLADCAKTVSAGAIVTAHHADDQAETILFRLTRGSGVSGLAGMAPQSSAHGAPLLRPLLGFTKSELVEICQNAGHRFFSDPSNANDAYARARLRKLMPLLAEQGLDREALLRLGERAARAEAALASCAAAAYERALTETAPISGRFDAAVLAELPLDILQRLLAREIARLAPQAQLRLDRLERAADRLSRALREKAPLRLTIADLLIESDGNNVTLRPAPPRRSA